MADDSEPSLQKITPDRALRRTPSWTASGGDINQTLHDWDERGVIPVFLDAEGGGFNLIQHPNDIGFILSDDQPFSVQDMANLHGLDSLSLGREWLQGHSCISIIHHLLDES